MQAEPRPATTLAEAMAAMDQLIATHLLAQQEMAQRLGLNITDLSCFGCVVKAGDNLLTAGDLAEHARVTTGAMTGILDRLERAGFITRRPDPTDRRRVRIAAQPSAVARVEALYAPYRTGLTALLADCSDDEVAVLTELFTRATALAHDHIRELQEPPRPQPSGDEERKRKGSNRLHP